MMMNHSTNALFFDDMEIPADSLVGEEGKGFQYILSGHERRAHPGGLGIDRRRPLVHREGGRLLRASG